MYRVVCLYNQQIRGRWIAWTLTVLYAMSDEWHQTMVAGRTGTIMDVGIDSLGAALSGLLLYLMYLYSEGKLLKNLLPLHKQKRIRS